MFIIEIIVLILAGISIGLLSGLLGIGGGIFFVPAILIFSHHYPPDAFILAALATSQAVIFLTTLFSSYVHIKKEAFVWDIFRKMIVGIVLGSFSGAVIAKYTASNVIFFIFGLFAIFFSLYFFIQQKKQEYIEVPLKHLGAPFLLIMGYISSVFASMLGIGGGVIFLPLLMYMHFPIRNAIGTSSIITMCLSGISCLSYLIFIDVSKLIPYTVRCIYLPALICLSIGSIFAAKVGAKLAHRLSQKVLVTIFCSLVVVIGILMLYKGL